ncbi:MAG: PEP-CTERM system TPR-repeat protein PrsT [Gammaproteobacteria bacterium]|nr:PEP-CTERM system TPR-repeat protein PrsT [Gammaproteobacteria bacterium]
MNQSRLLQACLFISLSGLLVVPVFSDTSDEVAGYYEDALRHFHQQDYRVAVLQLKNALQISPNDLPARVLLGQALLLRGEAASAEKELRLAQEMGADPGLTLLPLARALNQQKKYQELLQEIRPAKLRDGPIADLYVERGLAYLESRNLESARDAFDRSLQYPQSRPEAPLIGLAMVALAENNWAEAARLAEQAQVIAPQSPEVWLTQGAIAHARGDVGGAIDSYSRTLELDADHYAARISRASIYMEAGRVVDAIEDLELLSESSEWDPRAGYLLAIALQRSGDGAASRDVMERTAQLIQTLPYEMLVRDQAQLLIAGLVGYSSRQFESAHRYLSDYVERYPGNSVAYKLLGSTLMAMGKPLQAIPVFRTAVDLEPESAKAHALLGEAYLQERDYRSAIKSLEASLQLQPGQVTVLTQLGVARLAMRDEKGSIQYLEAALQGGDNPGTAEILSAVYLKAGNPDQAERVAMELLRQNPESLSGINLLASAHANQGKLELARKGYEKVLELNPDSRPAKINLAKLDLIERRPAAARERLDALLELYPDDTRLLFEMANLELQLGEEKKATQLLTKAYGFNPDAVYVGLKLIDLYLESGKHEAAEMVARELNGRHPEDPRILEALGRTQLALGQPVDARLAFRSAARQVGYDSAGLYRIARWQSMAGAPDDARWSLQKAVDGDEGHLPARLALCNLQIATGRLDDAEKLLEKLAVDYPGNPTYFSLAGDLAMARQQYESAVAHYDQALTLTEDPYLAIRVYRAGLAVGDEKQALYKLKTWASRRPDAKQVKRLLAEVHHRAGDLEEAKGYYEALYLVEPDNSALLNNLSNLYASMGDPRALEMASKAYRLAPDNVSVMDTLGWLLTQNGQARKGLSYLRDAGVRNANSPEIRYHLAVALETLGRTEEAERELRKSLSLADEFPGSDDAKRRLELLSQAGQGPR